jgi:multicomponent Na+:H+ antiporter subunit F
METIDTAYSTLLWASVIFLSLLLCICLVRAIQGPHFTDRVVAINLIGTKTIIIIAVLSHLLSDNGLLDIAIIYAMISFLVVVVLSKCYIVPHFAWEKKEEEPQ